MPPSSRSSVRFQRLSARRLSRADTSLTPAGWSYIAPPTVYRGVVKDGDVTFSVLHTASVAGWREANYIQKQVRPVVPCTRSFTPDTPSLDAPGLLPLEKWDSHPDAHCTLEIARPFQTASNPALRVRWVRLDARCASQVLLVAPTS